ncbi:hypothetical protein [Streptomyces sp. NPDC002490]|uniref:hypothetical protein n=1 Tax=Streptomyces sp. NPDC002490 TaxID=3154416 RepID=UPI00332A12FD
MKRQRTDAPDDPTDPSTPDPDHPTHCDRCGTTEGDPHTWTCSVENHSRRYFCVRCARDNLRSIEGRLDSPWW